VQFLGSEITVERVARAYEKTGRRRAFGAWAVAGEACCPLGALLLVEGVDVDSFETRPYGHVLIEVVEMADANMLEVCAFINGVDGNTGSGEAWELGRDCATA
jgi:hypothetical protein